MIQGGQHQMRQAFLGTDSDDGFAFRVDVDLIAILVPARDRPAQARDTTGGGVAMGVFTLSDLHQLFHDMRRRRAIGVAHAQVDDVLATAASGHLQFSGDVENVRGETIDARKAARSLVSHAFLEQRKRPEPSERRRPLRWPGRTIISAAGFVESPAETISRAAQSLVAGMKRYS